MSTIADKEPAPPADTPSAASELLQQRLAEAANYAVLRRIAPVLRHDVAGVMQPIGMLMMVLQRRMQMTDPDLAAITKNLASVSALTKEATTGCMNAMGWMVSGEGKPVSLRSGVNECIKLLETEFATTALKIVNGISDEQTVVPQNFLRSVVVGALLAFCDQRTAGTTLEVTLNAETGNSDTNRLLLRMLPGATSTLSASTEMNRQSRNIDWQDIEALAGSFNVTMARGEGWLTLDIPKND
jgi:hypothetical protein